MRLKQEQKQISPDQSVVYWHKHHEYLPDATEIKILGIKHWNAINKTTKNKREPRNELRKSCVWENVSTPKDRHCTHAPVEKMAVCTVSTYEIGVCARNHKCNCVAHIEWRNRVTMSSLLLDKTQGGISLTGVKHLLGRYLAQKENKNTLAVDSIHLCETHNSSKPVQAASDCKVIRIFNIFQEGNFPPDLFIHIFQPVPEPA